MKQYTKREIEDVISVRVTNAEDRTTHLIELKTDSAIIYLDNIPIAVEDLVKFVDLKNMEVLK